MKNKTILEKALLKDKKLIKDNALGDDRNLVDHGTDQHYWYSVGDGFRLVLWLRQKYLDYTNLSTVNAGEEYVIFRENNNKILVTDPYYTDNFNSYLNDDISRITATEGFFQLIPWTQMPTTIIIPLLSGLHWRTIKIDINYDDKTSSILFDDPYGEGAFPKNLKSTVIPVIKLNIEKLIRIQTVDNSFNLTEEKVETIEKDIDQQGHGENSWDCGTINFSNIEDYIKHRVGITEQLTYSITIYADLQHSEQITETRVNDIKRYSEITELPIDQHRLDEIKQQLETVRQVQGQKLKELSSISFLDLSDLNSLQVSMIFEVLDNKRLFEGKGKIGEYTKKELEYAYEVVSNERDRTPNVTDTNNLDTTKIVSAMKEQHNKQKQQEDLDKLIKVSTLVDQSIAVIEVPNLDTTILVEHMAEVGQLIHTITREDENEAIIRNKHGYRNPFNSNKKNTTGASLDFSALSHLKYLNEINSEELKNLLTTQPDLIKKSLNTLKQKIEFILSKESSNAPQILLTQGQSEQFESSDLGFLRKIIYYYHDLSCIDKLLLNLGETDTEWYKTLDLNNKEDRYALGYFFVQLGETVKEISDFVKPEIEDSNNFTRFLFGKLLGFRNAVKENPAIVHSAKDNKLVQMRIIIDEAQQNLRDFLGSIKEKLNTYLVGDIANNININYPSFHEFHGSRNVSEFENQHLLLIKILTTMLKVGTGDFTKEIPLITETISKIKLNIDKGEARIKVLSSAANDSLETPKQKLYKAALEMKSAKQIIGLSKLISEELLQNSEFSANQINLIKALRGEATSLIKPIKQEAIEQLKKLVDPYQQNLNTRIDEVNAMVKDAPKISAYDYNGLCELFKWLRSPDYHPEEIDPEYIKNTITLLQDKISIAESELKTQQECLFALENGQAQLSLLLSQPSSNPEPTVSSLPLSRFEKLVTQVIKETEFLQSLYTKLTEQGAHGTDTTQLTRLTLATQMSFSFLGQVHKLLKSNHQEKLDEMLIEHSILSDDCFEVIQIRHQQLMHNIIHNQLNYNELSQVIKNKIVPWLKDFKYMPICFKAQNMLSEPLVSGLIPEDSRLIANLNELTINDKQIFFWYTKIVAFNRFLQSDKAIEEYEQLKTQLSEKVNPELLTEIYWQASLAYRNLGDFEKVIEVLGLALISSEKIENESIKEFKVCGIHCDIGISYIQIDNLSEAENHLLQVTRNQKASPYQLIGANFLTGGVKIMQGYREIGKSYMELTFVKYFDQIIKYNPIIAFSTLEQLATFYLDEFNLESARDCLEFGISLYEQHYPEFISREGQHAIYYKTLLQNNIGRYDIIKALIKPNKESLKEIGKVYSSLLEEKKYRDTLPYFKDKKNSNLPLLQAAILNGTEEEMILTLLRDMGVKEDDILINRSELVKHNILKIKKEILEFQVDLFLERKTATPQEVAKHEKILYKLTKEITDSLELLAFKKFITKDFILAKELMKKAVLSQSIVDFIEFELEEEIGRVMENVAKQRRNVSEEPVVYIDEIVTYGMPQFIKWVENSNIEFNQLALYLHKKLFDPEFTQTFFQREDSIVRQYANAKHNKESLKNLISKYEMQLMSSFFNEEGKITTQFKIDEENELFITKYFDMTEDGTICIKERGYKLEDSSLQHQNTNHPDIVEPSSKLEISQKYKLIEKMLIEKFSRLKISLNCKDANLEISTKQISKTDLKQYCQSQLNINPTDLEFEEGMCLIFLHEEAIKTLHNKLSTNNYDGLGTAEYQIINYWNQYSKEGMKELLKLRLESLEIQEVKIIIPEYIWNNSIYIVEKLINEIISSLNIQDKVLVPLNLYGKHWVGLAVDRTEKKINISYMDPEQNEMPHLLKQKLQVVLTKSNPSSEINIAEVELVQQKYNNCGPEVIENFMLYLTGDRVPQEQAVVFHSQLLENELLSDNTQILGGLSDSLCKYDFTI